MEPEIPLCYAIEHRLAYRQLRYRDRVLYRFVVYRASLDADGRPAYLLKKKGKFQYFEDLVHWDALRYLNPGVPLHIPTMKKYFLLDAEEGKPISERDALVFAPHMTHPMAALDWLRDQLETQ